MRRVISIVFFLGITITGLSVFFVFPGGAGFGSEGIGIIACSIMRFLLCLWLVLPLRLTHRMLLLVARIARRRRFLLGFLLLGDGFDRSAQILRPGNRIGFDER